MEAIRCGLAAMTRSDPVALLLDDLQWSDEATLELLGALALPVRELPLLIVAAYRSDELSRAHPLRRLRDDLRRDRVLDEVALDPLGADEVGELLCELLNSPVSPRLAGQLYARAGGSPFFVEELALALEASGRLLPGPSGLSLALDEDVPLPATVRDAVLVQTARLSEPAREAAETAAVAGPRFDLAVVADLAVPHGLAELVGGGLIVEESGGWAAFRHPLVRDAIYEDIPWLRRSQLHRELAERLEPPAATRARSPSTGWPRATPCGRSTRCSRRSTGVRRARLPRRRAPRSPGARPVAGGRADRRARRPRSRPTRATPSSPATWPAPRGRSATSSRHAAPPAAAGRWPTPSGASPRSTRSRATARERSPRAGSPPRPTPPTACPATPRRSGS